VKLAYWHILKEKDFIDWIRSFDIDMSNVSTKRMEFNELGRKNELCVWDLDLIIQWEVDYKFDHPELGGCITKIFIHNRQNGFEHRQRFIDFIKNTDGKIRKYQEQGEGEPTITYYSDGSTIIDQLDKYMESLDVELVTKYIRHRKLSKILLSL